MFKRVGKTQTSPF